MRQGQIKDLHRFMAVVEAGSLSKAAEVLHISQPALTKSIQGIEEQLGVELFVRGARGITLTSYGRAVHFRGQLIEAETKKLHEDVSALRDLTFGHVRIGAPPGPGFHTHNLPDSILRLIGGGRKLSVHISMGTREQLLPILRQGLLDLIVAVIEEGEASSDLVQIPLFKDRNAIVVRAGHPLSKIEIPDVQSLAQYPWFVMSESQDLERSLREKAYAEGIELTQSIVFSDSSQFVKSAILASTGVGFLRYQALVQGFNASNIFEVPGDALFINSQGLGKHSMGLIYRKGAELSAACKQLMEEIQKSCSEDVVLQQV